MLTSEENELLTRVGPGTGMGELMRRYWLPAALSTGIEGINTQDHAIQESMGPIVNRTQEHFGPSDKAIIAARRSLLQAVRTAQEGNEPPGLSASYYSIRAIEKVLPESVDWRQQLMNEINPRSAT